MKGEEGMTTIDKLSFVSARRYLLAGIASATAADISAVHTCLEKGAGLLSLDASLMEPCGLLPERRVLYVELEQSLYFEHTMDRRPVNPAFVDMILDEWVPVECGSWESVLATLVIQGRWERIRETALELLIAEDSQTLE